MPNSTIPFAEVSEGFKAYGVAFRKPKPTDPYQPDKFALCHAPDPTNPRNATLMTFVEGGERFVNRSDFEAACKLYSSHLKSWQKRGLDRGKVIGESVDPQASLFGECFG